MTFRSKLFATVALPLLSASLIATPTLADALMKPFDVAQASDEGQPSEEELLKQQQEEQQRAEQEDQQRQADEQKAAEDQQQADEQKAAEDQQRQADEQKAAEDQQQADEQKAAEDQQRQADEQKAAEDQQQADEQKAAEDQQRQADEQKAAEDQQQADEQKAAEEQQRQADEQKAAEDQQRQADEQKAAEDQQRQADEQKAAEDQQRQTDEQKAAEDQQRQADEQKAAEEQQQQSEQPATEQSQQAGEETPATEPVPEVVETLTEEQKQDIAQDPGKTDETVVLPVENGAAVLDSDKDADNAGGQKSRDNRRKQREEQRAQEEDVPVPDTDDSAQAAISEEVRDAVPGRIEAAIKEEGKRVDEAPEFLVPETTNIVNNTVINNTTIVNNDNKTIDNSVTQVNVIERFENRTVLEVGDQLIVRGDDRPRLRRDSEDVFYDNLARGRVRETIQRPGGVRIVTIYNRYGDIIQRSRVGDDGREYIFVYAPELEDDAPRPGLVDVGYELPPMRLRIPVSDYIIDTSSDPDRDYYAFLAEPPVERVERVYTIDEVKQSARLRDKVRRIDLDTITFATASAEVPMSQARTLRSVADAMQKVLDKDPGETFLIEGHTDAVGSDKSNLVLSDERAESVASLLTEVYGIPPENLQTQGYGERFLKVRTEVAEQQNRRVTIRRVTTLVRPLAKAN